MSTPSTTTNQPLVEEVLRSSTKVKAESPQYILQYMYTSCIQNLSLSKSTKVLSARLNVLKI